MFSNYTSLCSSSCITYWCQVTPSKCKDVIPTSNSSQVLSITKMLALFTISHYQISESQFLLIVLTCIVIRHYSLKILMKNMFTLDIRHRWYCRQLFWSLVLHEFLTLCDIILIASTISSILEQFNSYVMLLYSPVTELDP